MSKTLGTLSGCAPWLCIASFTVLYGQAQAACDLSATGSAVQTCDSGSSGSLTRTTGDNTLLFPAGGTGSILGSVTYGAGSDRVEMSSGSVSGSFNLGDGVDRFTLTAGSITGDVNQGSGRDDFVMSGGSLRSLTQGDGLDTFTMTAGTISNAFEDGDNARMSGGTIGRVDMKLDDNIFDMSGGSIINNLVTGFGKDTITVSAGRIGGAISVSGGDDRITITGGEVVGEIRASFGNDSLTWAQAGVLRSPILMADGNDTATLSNLDEATLSANPLLDGGAGFDTLSFNAVTTAVPGRYANWETVSLNNGSRLDMVGNLTLGDLTSTTGVLNIDPSSTVTSATGSIRPFTTGQLASVNNAGTLDLITGSSINNQLAIFGNYTGTNARLLLRTVLGDDASATDKLVVSQGSIAGSTQVDVTNVGGVGAATQLNGIEVVQAINGAVSTDTAFSQGNSLSVGAYEYYLFKGGATAGSENSWFLRSTVLSPPAAPIAVPSQPAPAPEAPVIPPVIPETPTVPAPPVTPETPTVPVPPVTPETPTVPVPPVPPVTPETPETPETPTVPPVTPETPTVPVPPVTPETPSVPVAPVTPGTPTVPVIPPAAPTVQPAATLPVAAIGTPRLPAPAIGAAPVPLYRLEVPNYAVVTPAAASLTLISLGTFHDRQGEQSLLSEQGWLSAGWARVFGADFKRSWSGTVDPNLDASLKGYQVGHDLFSAQLDSGQTQRAGLFVGHTRLDGHVDGFAGGFKDRRTGKLKLEGDSVGAYWTLTDPQGWYFDAVAMGTRLDGYSRSDRGVRIDTEGHAVTLSVEAGYPIKVSSNWVIEPQAQLINQHIKLDSQNDGISDISFDSQAWNTARLGARLKGRYAVQGMPVEPYVRANLWRNFGGSDSVTFNHTDSIKTEHRSTTADLGLGLVAKVSKDIGVYISADYSSNLDDNDLNGVVGNLGVRVSW